MRLKKIVVERWQIFLGLLFYAFGEGIEAHDWAYHVMAPPSELMRIHGFHIGLVISLIGITIMLLSFLHDS